MIDRSEISYRTSRSGGSGGQNVNKVETAVEALWKVEGNASLDAGQTARLLEKLANRINKDGYLQVRSTTARTQAENKAFATERLLQLVSEALKTDKPRKATRIPRAVKEKNKLNKLHHALKKENRKSIKRGYE